MILRLPLLRLPLRLGREFPIRGARLPGLLLLSGLLLQVRPG